MNDICMKLKMHSIFCIPIGIEFAFGGGKVGDNIIFIWHNIYKFKKKKKFVTEKKENRRANTVAFGGNSLTQTQKTTNLFLALFLGYIFFSQIHR